MLASVTEIPEKDTSMVRLTSSVFSAQLRVREAMTSDDMLYGDGIEYLRARDDSEVSIYNAEILLARSSASTGIPMWQIISQPINLLLLYPACTTGPLVHVILHHLLDDSLPFVLLCISL